MRQRLTETSADDGQPLDVNGRRLIDCHEQIVGILRNRLGQNHADLFAQPVSGEGSRSIAWFTTTHGSIAPEAALPPEQQQRLKERAKRICSDIEGLAAEMQSEGPTGRIVGQMLLGAAQLPPGARFYSVGGKPVVVLWGHRGGRPPSTSVDKTSEVGSRALTESGARSTGGLQRRAAIHQDVARDAAGQPGGASAVAASTGSAGLPGQWTRWLVPGLLALTLLAVLLWGLKSCSFGRSAPELLASHLEAKIAEAEARNRALEAEIARRNAKGARFICVPEARPPRPRASKESSPAQSEQPPSSETAQPSPRDAQREKVAKKASEAAPPQVARIAPPSSSRAAPGPPLPATTPKQQSPVRSACRPPQPGDEPELVMIVDGSGSMRESFAGGGSRMEAAKRGADSMIRSLPPEVDVALVDFAACGQVRRDKFYSSGRRGALIGEINALQPKAGTPLADAIERAGAIASSTAASVMVVVSDGGDSCGGDPCAAARAIKANKPNVTINVVDVSKSARERQILQCIASAGGGRVLSPGDSVDMTRKMKEAAGAANCA